MSETLLTTKLNIPPLRRETLTRPLLTAQLNEGIGHTEPFTRKLTLVSAPAGFGKSTLITQWLQRSNLPVAWLSLDEGENDLVRYFSYLAAALENLGMQMGKSLTSLLKSPQTRPAQSLIASFNHDVPEEPFILVLDDFHVLSEVSVFEAMRLMIKHQPAQMHLVITTRKDPPLQLARLRAAGQMTEIRARDLRFTKAEIARFFNEVMGLDLTAVDIATLEARTEGWIAGLHLAALSLHACEGPANRSTFIQAFAGDDRHVMDYLISEVLSRQTDEVRSFLLQTAILNNLSGPLCDAVVNDGHLSVSSQELLEYLDEANLFIVPLDNQRRWFRYHHLFADLLRYRLLREHPERISQLHINASSWFVREGRLEEAVEHARAAKDYDRAIELLEPLSQMLISESKLSSLLGFLSKIPEEYIYRSPWLCVNGAWANLLSGRMGEVEPLLLRAESNLERKNPESFSDYRRIHGNIITIRSYAARWLGDDARSIELSKEAEKNLPEESFNIRCALALNLGNAHISLGELEAARLHYDHAVKLGRQAGHHYIVLTAMANLAQLNAMQGQLRMSATIAREAVKLGIEWGEGHPLPATGRAHLRLGRTYFEWNDLEQARSHILQGIKLGEQAQEIFIVIEGLISLSWFEQVGGNPVQANKILEELQQIRSNTERVQEVGEVEELQVRLWLAQGEFDSAFRWANRHAVDSSEDFKLIRFYEEIAISRVFIAQGRPKEALSNLEKMIESAEDDGRKRDCILIQILIALTHHSMGDRDRAIAALELALNDAEPEGYIRTFVDEGARMAQLLYKALSIGIYPEYVSRLLEAFPQEGDKLDVPQSEQGEIVEPLTSRELEVLRLIAAGLSNQGIAQELNLALDTVKGHSRNIYGKLNVHSRTEAVAKARTFGILPVK